MKLFISHAHEDKEDFVRPLAEQLRADFEVWYDEYVLTLGDSLRRKIEQGLSECDYGVVVLSRAFFSKHWPQSELDGLNALETERRKVILPIWKGLNYAEVAQFSPMLAGRYAAKTSDGLAAVINQIKQAVGVGERVASFNGLGALKAQLLDLDRASSSGKAAARLMDSERGVELGAEAGKEVCNQLERSFEELQEGLKSLQINSKRRQPDSFEVAAAFGLTLHAYYSNSISNSLRFASFDFFIYKFEPGYANYSQAAGNKVVTEKYTPWFQGETVVWRQGENRVFTTDQLSEYVIQGLINQLARFSAEHEKRNRRVG